MASHTCDTNFLLKPYARAYSSVAYFEELPVVGSSLLWRDDPHSERVTPYPIQLIRLLWASLSGIMAALESQRTLLQRHHR